MPGNMSNPTIGFIGLGHMGRGMAGCLLRAGYPLHILAHRNRAAAEELAAQGAIEAATAGELAARVDILHLCLPDSDAVEAVMLGETGVLAGARPGLIVIDTTTADPGSTVRLAKVAHKKGCTLVDAPLGRTPAEAAQGTLDTMVGCDAETFARIRPILETWARNILHVGPVGSGHKMKLITNFISTGYGALYAEALALTVRSGLTPQQFRDAIANSRMANGFFETFMAGAVGRDAEAHKFTLANAAKDNRYIAQMALDAGVPSPLGAAVRNTYAQAVAAGKGADFLPTIADHVAALCGLDLASEVAKGKLHEAGD